MTERTTDSGDAVRGLDRRATALRRLGAIAIVTGGAGIGGLCVWGLLPYGVDQLEGPFAVGAIATAAFVFSGLRVVDKRVEAWRMHRQSHVKG